MTLAPLVIALAAQFPLRIGDGTSSAGIQAISGATRVGDRIYLVSDEREALFWVDEGTTRLEAWAFPGASNGPIPKPVKPDFEALAALPGEKPTTLVAFPSASTPARLSASVIELGSDGRPARQRRVSIAPFAARLGALVPGLNLEGLVLGDTEAKLFQRGNEKGSRNGVFIVPMEPFRKGLANGDWKKATESVRFDPHDLGKLAGVPLSYTDAVAHGDAVLALAAAETGESSYRDGTVAGSALLLIRGSSVKRVAEFTPALKLEALAVIGEKGDSLELALFDDADGATAASSLYRARIPLARLAK